MGLTWKENQPVFFGEEDECSNDEVYPAQIVDNTDNTRFQFDFTPCDETLVPILLTDPNFGSWTLSSNWQVTNVQGAPVCSDGSGSGLAIVYSGFNDDDFIVGGSYTFEIPITVTSGSVYAYLGSTLLGIMSETGTYTFSGVATANLTYGTKLFFSALSGTVSCISAVSAFGNALLDNIIIAIYNSAGVYQNQISYANDPDQFVFTNNTVTISVNWADLGLSNNCYYLCLLDPCENTNGQNYPPNIDLDRTRTTVGSDWVWSTDRYIGTYGDGSLLTQSGVFATYSNYCIKFTVEALVGTVNVYYGANLVGTITANGETTITGIPNGNFTLSLQMTTGSYVELIGAEACEVLPADYVCDLRTPLFSLSDYSDDCTLMINACNNEDGLGFEFNSSGFSPAVRLEAKLRQAKYASERTIYDDSVGKRKVVYFSGRKQKNLCIDLQPEYIHDFLRLLVGFDNVRINNELYSVDDDEYNVEYADVSDSIGKVKLLVSKRTQNVTNINCSDAENVCNLPPNYLLQADDLGQYITLTNGELILING